VPPNALNPAISPALNAVVMRALAKNKDERFQTAADFTADLDIAATGKVPDRAPSGDDFNATLFGVSPNSTAASSATLRRLAEDQDESAPRTQSRPPVAWIWGGVAVMAVIIVAALVWVFSLTPQNLVGPGASVQVPNVIGMDYGHGGQTKLQAAKLKPTTVTQPSDSKKKDTILSIDPPVGTKVIPGTAVTVTLSSGPPAVTLPGLVFKSQADAEAAITGAGLKVGQVSQQDSPTVAQGAVIGVQVAGMDGVQTTNIQVAKGETVDIIVSTGQVNVPDQRGQPFATARDLLSGPDYGLQVKLQANSGCGGGNVTTQSLIGEAAQKSAVTLTYCSG
jgi:eukaryotic-like serine/threonine-protein kinase